MTGFDWLPRVPAALDLLIAVGGSLAALGIIYRFAWKPIRAGLAKANQAADSMLGYPEVVDPGTGRVIQQATPPMAHRVYALEEANTKTAHALEAVAEALTLVTDLQRRFEDHERQSHLWWREHEEWAQNWIKDHEALHLLSAEARAADAGDKHD